ncbi:MAG: dTMP kinase, partial [Candidatus Omnitrophica bacterium]|nr:dTMP kinase [Candidatus Omnitrophota bacterium]
FEAARSQIVEEIISPALKKDQVVICDRFGEATVAYQGYAGGVDVKMIKALNSLASGGLKPDLTVFLDIDTATGLKRARIKGADRMEKKDAAYHKKVRRGYLSIVRKEPGRVKIIKVKENIADTQKDIRKLVLNVISRY